MTLFFTAFFFFPWQFLHFKNDENDSGQSTSECTGTLRICVHTQPGVLRVSRSCTALWGWAGLEDSSELFPDGD